MYINENTNKHSNSQRIDPNEPKKPNKPYLTFIISHPRLKRNKIFILLRSFFLSAGGYNTTPLQLPRRSDLTVVLIVLQRILVTHRAKNTRQDLDDVFLHL